ncbi:MAG: TraR/DksA C4-type zinc finger protein [Armatimonadota bacterium]
MPRKRKLDVEEFKKRLLEEKERLTEHIKRLDDQTSGRDRFNRDTPSRDFDELGGDAAFDTAQRGQVQAVGDNFREILEAVNAALDKIEKGTYGICDRCGKNITKARLEFLPYASLCKKCRKELSA